jgi:BASS family bile acid:Na+ symporter
MEVDAIRLNFQENGLWILNGILALIMFGVALDLRWADFKRIAHAPRAPLIGVVAQFLIMPAFTFVLTLILQPLPSVALGMILIAACPGGNLSNFLTWLAKGNAALSVTMTAISTILAMVLTPLNLTFWGSLNPATAAILRDVSLDPMQMLTAVIVLLGIPLVAGIAFARRFPLWAARIQKPFKFAGIAFFLLFIVIVFSQNFDIFTNYIGWVALAVILHNATAFAVGYGSAWLLRLHEPERRAIAIEVGIQNSALGLVLIFAFFDGLGGMALVAGAWGIWHIISGLTLAFIWSRRGERLAIAEEAV